MLAGLETLIFSRIQKVTLETAVCGLEDQSVKPPARRRFPVSQGFSGLLVPVSLTFLDVLAGLETFISLGFRK